METPQDSEINHSSVIPLTQITSLYQFVPNIPLNLGPDVTL
jgi:hypothetical protein